MASRSTIIKPAAREPRPRTSFRSRLKNGQVVRHRTAANSMAARKGRRTRKQPATRRAIAAMRSVPSRAVRGVSPAAGAPAGVVSGMAVESLRVARS